MFFQLFSTIKVNPAAKIMQSAYLCVIFHVKPKKSPFIAHLTWFLILGKIQQGGQDGVHCWLRHRPPAAPPPIKYTPSCREDQRLSIQLARGSREFTRFCLHKKWMPRSYLRGEGVWGFQLTGRCIRIFRSLSRWGYVIQGLKYVTHIVKQWVNRENGLKKEWQCVCCSSLRLWFL